MQQHDRDLQVHRLSGSTSDAQSWAIGAEYGRAWAARQLGQALRLYALRADQPGAAETLVAALRDLCATLEATQMNTQAKLVYVAGPYDAAEQCKYCGIEDGITDCVEDGVCRECAAQQLDDARERAIEARVEQGLDP
jgi:hypothetical protein